VKGSLFFFSLVILCNEVALLVNEEVEKDVHDVLFDASGLSSGVYFYTLTAGQREKKNALNQIILTIQLC
jgi:hypothetical protein